MEGSVQFPFKGLDSVWLPIDGNSVTELTVDYPPLRLLRGVYTWGWRVHPPRIQFLQPIYEMVNAHTSEVELEPQGESFAFRNRQLSLEDISAFAADDHVSNVLELVSDPRAVVKVSDAGKTRLARFSEVMTAALKRHDRVPLHGNVEAAWLNLGGSACIESSDIEDCRRYFEMLENLDRENTFITPEILANAVDRLWTLRWVEIS